MIYWIRLAFKNIMRNRQRTFLTMLPVIFGTAILIYVLSMLEGVNNDSKQNLINYEFADLRVVHREYTLDRKGFGIQKPFDFPKEVKKLLEESEFVHSFAKEIVFTGNLSDGDNRLSVVCRGVDFKEYDKTFMTMKRTSPLAANLRRGEILIGDDLIKWYKIPFDSLFVVQSRTKEGTFDAVDLYFSGIVSTGNPKIDRMTIYMNIDDADRFLGLEGNISSVAVKLKNKEKLGDFKKEMDHVLKNFPQLKIVTWEEMASDIIAIDSAKRYSSSVIVLIVLIIGGVGIANTILLSVYERMKEIGTMRAIGASNSTIVKMFVFEGASVGFVAAAIGMILGTAVMAYISFIGIDIGEMIKDMDIGYPIKSVFKGRFDILLSLKAGLFGLLIGVAASFYPAYRVVKENIVRTLK